MNKLTFSEKCRGTLTLMAVVILNIAFGAVATLYATSAPKITVRNANGKIIGYFEGTVVRNANSKIIGYIKNGKTYDANMKLIASPEVPGLLLCGE